MAELKPCPFCGCKMEIGCQMNVFFPKAEDWHDDDCPLSAAVWNAEMCFGSAERIARMWNRRSDDA